MTTLVGAQARRRCLALLVASLGLVLASACDGSKPATTGENEAATPSSEPPPSAEQPEGLGLEDGQAWRLELDGEAPLAGKYGGESVQARRKADDLSLSLQGQDISVVITLEQAPMGQTGRYTATPARLHATSRDIDCGTAMGGTIKINLTHNEVERVAGRIEGSTGCKQLDGGHIRWSGAFDYAGAIDFQ
jgi:hypothetical protein